MVRALLDANVLVSALLAWNRPTSTVTWIVQAAVRRVYTLLLPDDVLDEAIVTVTTVPALAARIAVADASAFVVSVTSAAEQLPPLSAPPPAMTRDPKDDYLLAHALAGRADYLVTGDKDLLVLAGAGFPFQIVTPAQFLSVLEGGLLDGRGNQVTDG